MLEIEDGKQHGIGIFKTAKGDYRRGEWKVAGNGSSRVGERVHAVKCALCMQLTAGWESHPMDFGGAQSFSFAGFALRMRAWECKAYREDGQQPGSPSAPNQAAGT